MKYVNIFQKRYEKSEAKERLINTEIESYEKLLFPKKLQIHIKANIIFPLEELIMPSGEIPDFSKMIVPGGHGINPDYNGDDLFIWPKKAGQYNHIRYKRCLKKNNSEW